MIRSDKMRMKALVGVLLLCLVLAIISSSIAQSPQFKVKFFVRGTDGALDNKIVKTDRGDYIGDLNYLSNIRPDSCAGDAENFEQRDVGAISYLPSVITVTVEDTDRDGNLDDFCVHKICIYKEGELIAWSKEKDISFGDNQPGCVRSYDFHVTAGQDNDKCSKGVNCASDKACDYGCNRFCDRKCDEECTDAADYDECYSNCYHNCYSNDCYPACYAKSYLSCVDEYCTEECSKGVNCASDKACDYGCNRFCDRKCDEECTGAADYDECYSNCYHNCYSNDCYPTCYAKSYPRCVDEYCNGQDNDKNLKAGLIVAMIALLSLIIYWKATVSRRARKRGYESKIEVYKAKAQKRKEEIIGKKELIKPEHLPLIGGCVGGLIGILFSLILQIQNEVFVLLNTLILGTITGCAYGWITAKIFSEDISNIKKGVVIGGVIGAVSGVHPISLSVFVFGYGFSLVYLLLLSSVDEDYWPLRGKSIEKRKAWSISIVSGAVFGAVFGGILWKAEGFIGGMIVGAIPGINIGFGFILGSFLGAAIMESVAIQLAVPVFLIPLLAIAGYFMGKKFGEKEEYVEWMRSGYDKVVQELSSLYSLYKLLLIAYFVITAVLIMLSFWAFIQSFISMITPFLTYSNMMRIVVVGVVIYIVVNVLRILRKK